jgi:Ca2+-transporting ATPase
MQSMALFALGATQLAAALGSRARPGTWANPILLAAVATALGLQLAAVYIPPLADLLGTQPLPPADLLIVCAASTLGYAAIRLDRVVHSARRRAPPTGLTPGGSGDDAPRS